MRDKVVARMRSKGDLGTSATKKREFFPSRGPPPLPPSLGTPCLWEKNYGLFCRILREKLPLYPWWIHIEHWYSLFGKERLWFGSSDDQMLETIPNWEEMLIASSLVWWRHLGNIIRWKSPSCCIWNALQVIIVQPEPIFNSSYSI